MGSITTFSLGLVLLDMMMIKDEKTFRQLIANAVLKPQCLSLSYGFRIVTLIPPEATRKQLAKSHEMSSTLGGHLLIFFLLIQFLRKL
jgi:hypothetical protein